MNTPVAIAQIIARTLIELAGIGAAVKLLPAVLPRLSLTAQRQPKPPEVTEHQITVHGPPEAAGAIADAMRAAPGKAA